MMNFKKIVHSIFVFVTRLVRQTLRVIFVLSIRLARLFMRWYRAQKKAHQRIILGLGIGIGVLLVTFFLMFVVFNPIHTTKVNSTGTSAHSILERIEKVAQDYKKEYRGFGLLSNQQVNNNCFERLAFTTAPGMMQVFEEPNISAASCVYKADNGAIDDWSISIVIDDKVFCVDSHGDKRETPGITVTASCSGE